jgi:hypothetical protein
VLDTGPSDPVLLEILQVDGQFDSAALMMRECSKQCVVSGCQGLALALARQEGMVACVAEWWLGHVQHFRSGRMRVVASSRKQVG